MRESNMTKSATELEALARELRARIVAFSSRTGTPHLGSCLSCLDILTALYFNILRVDPENPYDDRRDRFILSKGHGAPALFQVLAMRGFFPESDLLESDHDGSGYFGEHPPTPGHLAGIEAATGSLGHGLPIGLGMAIAARLKGLDYKVYAVLSDGECNEGSIWEAAMFAAAQRLENLAVIVDFNKWQATGRSEDVLGPNSLEDKWRSFGWSTHSIDGHDMNAILDACRELPDGSGKPVAIIADTVKGKGVSFMEDDNNWHYRIPSAEEVDAAKRELGVLA